jgi:choline dehydrogenase-like flavoprotein
MGGFSNIWGAAVLAPDDCDMVDWPISRADMTPYFRRAAGLMPLCGGGGTLDTCFPSYAEELGTLDPGPQGEALLRDLRKAECKLRLLSTVYGSARLAIHTKKQAGTLPCNGCGECFTGCVRGSIFATPPLLHELVRSNRVSYRPQLFVERVDELDGRVHLYGLDLKQQAPCRLEFDAVFIAAGPIETTRILLRSRNLYDQPILLKESQKFVVPVLRGHAAPTAIEHPSVTLASVFLETKVKALSDHWLHVQIVPLHRLITERCCAG